MGRSDRGAEPLPGPRTLRRRISSVKPRNTTCCGTYHGVISTCGGS